MQDKKKTTKTKYERKTVCERIERKRRISSNERSREGEREGRLRM